MSMTRHFPMSARSLPPRAPSLPGYAAARRSRRAIVALLGFAFLYGLFIAVYIGFRPLQLTVPLVVLVGLVIWALPDYGRAPVRLLTWTLFAVLVALLAWPDYLALALPGLPWITAMRLTTVPMTIILLVCLSISGDFRDRLRQILSATPLVWKLLTAFAAIAAISIVFSGDPGLSVSKLIVAALYWFAVYFAAVMVFARPERPRLLAIMVVGFVVFVCLIALLEWRMQAVPWAGHIPSFLKIEDEAVQRILSFRARAATGIYRVQSKFTTPLGLAEFLALGTPFVLYFVLNARNWLWKAFNLALLPLIFYCIILTDSRLGYTGFFLSVLFYVAAWGVLRWRDHRGSLIGPAVTLAYPVMFGAFLAGTIYIGRLRAMVWGTGAQSFSTQAREQQWEMGVPMVLSHPWGFGIGRGAETLGFTNLAGVLTIDTYYLAVALEYGILGFLVYYGMLLAQLFYGINCMVRSRAKETHILVPFLIALINFLVIKSVFSQQENHPLMFAMLGGMTALVYLIKKADPEAFAADRAVRRSPASRRAPEGSAAAPSAAPG